MKENNQYAYQNIFETFDSSEHGLDTNETAFRLKKYGPNQLSVKKNRPLIWQFLGEYRDPMTLLLLLATLIACFSGDLADAVLIFIVLLLNGLISFIQKHKAEKAIEALKKMVSPQARVIRNHQQMLIGTPEIVPGDLIIISEGDTIPADAIVFAANELETSEAILTGESFPVAKTAFDTKEKGNVSTTENIIFMGTIVSRGNAQALVIRTGMDTEFGKIANLTQETEKDQTPLEKEIFKVGIFAAQLTFVIVVLIFVYELLVHQRNILDNLLFAASVAVAAVPEGLPAVITIALALGVQLLSRKKAIIRQLSAVETLGATTVICTDKTGTLTKNEMTVTEALIDNLYLSFPGTGYAPAGKFRIFAGQEETLDMDSGKLTPDFCKKRPQIAGSLKWFSLCAELCNNASLLLKDNNYTVIGDPTEGGLLSMARKISSDLSAETRENLELILELPFDSERKMMSKIFFDKKHNKYYSFTKGAPEQIIQATDQRMHGGRMAILTKSVKDDLLFTNEKFNESALRTIGLAYKEISGYEMNEILGRKNFTEKAALIERKMIFLGLAGLNDPPREEVKEAVALTRIAGIRTYVVTGDHGFTTAAIARQVGLISTNRPYEIITGEQLDKLSGAEIKAKFNDRHLDLIFSRTRAEHKLRLVSLLKENGEIVAVTGDGVNDAPALKRADIGVAMGLTGSDVTKEASDMVLLDDSFHTIVTAIREGRVIFANLKKFIYYIFSSNIGEVFTIFFGLLIGLPVPITAVLILTVNLVTDLLPALALSVEPAEKNIMQMPPRRPTEKILNRPFIKRIFLTGALIGMISLGLFIYKLLSAGWYFGGTASSTVLTGATSITFMSMVLLEVANSFNAKTETLSVFSANPFNNLKLLWANLSSVLIAVAIVEIPFLQQVFQTAHLELLDWLLLVAGCLLVTIIQEILKSIDRRKKHLLSAHVHDHHHDHVATN